MHGFTELEAVLRRFARRVAAAPPSRERDDAARLVALAIARRDELQS